MSRVSGVDAPEGTPLIHSATFCTWPANRSENVA